MIFRTIDWQSDRNHAKSIGGGQRADASRIGAMDVLPSAASPPRISQSSSKLVATVGMLNLSMSAKSGRGFCAGVQGNGPAIVPCKNGHSATPALLQNGRYISANVD